MSLTNEKKPDELTYTLDSSSPLDLGTQKSLNASESSPKQFKPGFQIGITMVLSSVPTILFLIFRMVLTQDISKIYLPLIAFPLQLLIIRKLYPDIFQFPFGKVSASEFAEKVGLIKSNKFGRQLILGIILAICSLTGLFIGSSLTGRYEFDWTVLTLEQVFFATVPGVWEEVYFRGILMLILLRIVKNFKKTVVLQCVIFGLAHFYGFFIWELVDLFSITLLGFSFTWVAHKTNSLVSGIVYHTLHDAFLFLFLVADESLLSHSQNAVFFLSLWVLVGIGCGLTKFLTEKWQLAEPDLLYSFDKVLLKDN